MTTTQIRFVLQAVTTDPALLSQSLDLDLSPELTMYPSRETGSGNTTDGSSSPSGSPPSTYAPPDNSASPGWGSGGNPLGGGGYGGIDTQPSFPGGTGGGATTPSVPPPQGSSDPKTFANQLVCMFQSAPMIPVDQTSEITVRVTNNALTPFYKGIVFVELPEGVEFRNQDDRCYVDQNTGAISRAMELPLTDADGNEIPIRQGETVSLLLRIAPRKAVNISIKATVFGQDSAGQWLPIAGESAQGKRTIGVLP